MSVYKPQKSRYWQYDFQLKGVRFHGSTGQTTRRAAEAVERKLRLDAATGALGRVAEMTLDAAALRYWVEKGIHRGDAADVERRLSALIALMGKATRLGDIDQPAVARAIETRRGRLTYRSPAKDATGRLPSNATVNRDVIETLRPILKRARTHWSPRGQPHGLPEIDWAELRLPEPRPQSRIYTRAQREAWIAACTDGTGLALDMILTYGLRFSELLFGLDALNLDPLHIPADQLEDGEGPTLELHKGRKRDVILYLPLTRAHARELAVRACRAREAGLDTVWFLPAGDDLVAMTKAQIEYRLSRAADEAGIPGSRRIHGGRHHAGSTILRRTGNLKAVQSLLGHASIHSSQRYAHVLAGQLRDALEADGQESRHSPEADADVAPQSKAG